MDREIGAERAHYRKARDTIPGMVEVQGSKGYIFFNMIPPSDVIRPTEGSASNIFYSMYRRGTRSVEDGMPVYSIANS